MLLLATCFKVTQSGEESTNSTIESIETHESLTHIQLSSVSSACFDQTVQSQVEHRECRVRAGVRSCFGLSYGSSF